MPPIKCHTRTDFLKNYRFPRTADPDFQLNGEPSIWARENPRSWSAGEMGSETDSFEFGKAMKVDAEGLEGLQRPHRGFHSAVSPDRKLVAVGSDYRVLVYDLRTKELRQVLDGGGGLAFRPTMGSGVDDVGEGGGGARSGYTLFSGAPEAQTSVRYDSERLVVWELDREGRLLDVEEAVDADDLAARAVEAILPQLRTTHEWSAEFVEASDLHRGFKGALNRAAVAHRLESTVVIENVGYGLPTCSSDGKYLLYRKRKVEDGEEAFVVYDLENNRESHRLSGLVEKVKRIHFTPDNKSILCIACSRIPEIRRYSASTGELEWTCDTKAEFGGPSFSPDLRYLLCNKNLGREPGVILDVASGEVCGHLPAVLSTTWLRDFRCQWHPDGQQIAVSCSKTAYIVRPFDGDNGVITQTFKPERVKHDVMFEFTGMQWWDNGRLLCLETDEGSALIYDTQTNAKEMLRRVQGEDHNAVTQFYGLFGAEGGEGYYLSVHGDGIVRYWDRTVTTAEEYAQIAEAEREKEKDALMPSPGWWEKKEGKEALPKREYPETGKYVKVTKPTKADDNKLDGTRADWAERGAGLWTAE
ncbi:unnamed protein product [Periconia digitata]|uniref:Uncharacterized protein n=1 Tax=Periconia digitata TaxID=1303443 RepID=A0A9W4UBC1_9PLEO|nr:unnamed protein product [Periconia digitata]